MWCSWMHTSGKAASDRVHNQQSQHQSTSNLAGYGHLVIGYEVHVLLFVIVAWTYKVRWGYSDSGVIATNCISNSHFLCDKGGSQTFGLAWICWPLDTLSTDCDCWPTCTFRGTLNFMKLLHMQSTNTISLWCCDGLEHMYTSCTSHVFVMYHYCNLLTVRCLSYCTFSMFVMCCEIILSISRC